MNPETVVITDTSCLIILYKIGALEILPKVFKKVVITPEIATEYGQPLPAFIKIIKVNDTALLAKYRQLVDLGEASAITLALSLENALLVLDDFKGRKLAQQLSLPVIGTIGVLVQLRETGQISSLRPYFDAILSTDFRIDNRLLDHVLKNFND